MVENESQHSMNGNIKKIGDLIKEIGFAMLTTTDENGKLQSRPMHTQQVAFDGDVYFFTYDNSEKAQQIQRHPQVNLAYAAPNKNDYLSLAGTATIIHDKDKMKELWQPQLKAWFPEELDTPHIALLKVSSESAEFWDAPSSTVAHVVGLVKSALTGQPANIGDNETLELKK